jgi:hypothetical protein
MLAKPGHRIYRRKLQQPQPTLSLMVFPVQNFNVSQFHKNKHNFKINLNLKQQTPTHSKTNYGYNVKH